MFFIPLILTAGLDMSLPEFQSQPDLSGNVIVGSFDKEDPIDVLPLEDISINDLLNDDVTDNDKKSVSDNDKKTAHSDGDISSNDKVRDSGGKSAGSGTKAVGDPVAPDGYHYEPMTSSNLPSVRIETVNNVRQLVSRSGYSQNYFYLEANHTYYMSTSGTNIYYGPDITIGTVIDVHTANTWEYTPTSNVYVFSSGVYTFFCSELVADSPDISGSDYSAVVEALAIINDNITDINDKLDDLSSAGADDSEVLDRHTQLLRAMLLCLLITFLYPISLSIVRNIVGGDSNV